MSNPNLVSLPDVIIGNKISKQLKQPGVVVDFLKMKAFDAEGKEIVYFDRYDHVTWMWKWPAAVHWSQMSENDAVRMDESYRSWLSNQIVS